MKMETRTYVRLFLALQMLLTGTALFAQGNKPPGEVQVINTPGVHVVNTPAVTVTSMPGVNIANVPDVKVTNTAESPIPVTIVGGDGGNGGPPAFAASPIFSFKNAEGGGKPIIFGPLAPNQAVGIGSLTFDGGDATFGTQLWLYVTDCPPTNNLLHTVGAYMVRNWAAGTGPQHMTFPVHLMLPLQPVNTNWCLQASPVTGDQILITAVGYLIQP